MGTVFFYALRESVSRRMGVVMIILSLLVPTYYMWSLRFVEDSGNSFIVIGEMKVPAAQYVKSSLNLQFIQAREMWTLLVLFLAAPLLSSYLEKGWVDLLLTKRVPRWQFLLGRMAACLFFFLLVLFVMQGVPALYIGARVGISAAPFFGALALVAFSFLCITSLLALTSMAVPNTAMLVIVGFVQINFSRLLAEREAIVRISGMNWLKPPMDFLHAILPRTKEIGDIAADVLNNQPVGSWAPFWWSAALVVIYTGVACIAFHRKPI